MSEEDRKEYVRKYQSSRLQNLRAAAEKHKDAGEELVTAALLYGDLETDVKLALENLRAGDFELAYYRLESAVYGDVLSEEELETRAVEFGEKVWMA